MNTQKSADSQLEELGTKISLLPPKLFFESFDIVFVLGGPGSGKGFLGFNSGTQCSIISKTLGYSHISTGDCLRAEVAAKSKIGVEAEALMKEGKMIPIVNHFSFRMSFSRY